MGQDSKIEWTHHTFNPWWGCAKVSPGCTNCYAETLDKRFGGAHGWVLVDVVRIDPPIPCRGNQKLWRVPEEITNALQAAGHTIHTH